MAIPRDDGFYVYLKFDRRGIPLWVGKGYGDRSGHDELGASLPTVLLREDLTEREAYSLERVFIEAIGQRRNGTGPLVNHHPGGTGGKAGRSHNVSPEGRARLLAVHTGNIWNLGNKRSAATRTKQSAGVRAAWEAGKYAGNGAKIGARLTGLKQSAETIAKRVEKNTGKRRSEVQRARMSAAQKGREVSAETRAKLSAALTGRRRIRQQSKED